MVEKSLNEKRVAKGWIKRGELYEAFSDEMKNQLDKTVWGVRVV